MLKRIVLGLVMSGVAIFSCAQSVSAQTINYQILKYGTNETSYASAYFLNPANVTVDKNNYRVSLTVATKHELGRFPVKVQNINGQAPQISESTQGNMDYYTVAFTAKDLRPKMTGAMHVDVDSLDYHHQYAFNLKFDTSNLPALSVKSDKVASNSSASSQATSQVSSTQSSLASSQATSQASNTQSSSASSQTASQASSTQSSSATNDQSASLAGTKVKAADAKPVAKSADNKITDSLWTYVGGGIISGGILIGLLKYFSSRQKKN